MQIKRSIKTKILQHLNQPEITLIVGPRQVGKTTLISEISDELNEEGKRTLTLNLDIQDDFTLLETQSKLIKRLELEFGTGKGYVFIDEVQRKEDAGRFFKGIYDMKLPYKFILTGSGSVELKEKISESLAGRKRMFEMYPVTFLEFIDYRTNYKYSDKLNDFLLNNDPRLGTLFSEYFEFGGYPRIILADTLDSKRLEMQEIYNSYLEKDIVQLLKVQKTEAFSKLITLLASQIGRGINVQELSNTLGLDSDTIRNYLWYLEKTFIIQICRPFYTNTRSELTKTPICYFLDIGLRNYILNRFSNQDLKLTGGHLFENFIFNHINTEFNQLDPTINYWRTKDGAEVDFIFKIGTKLVPIEAKFSNLSKATIGKSLYNFVERYNPHKSFIINLNLEDSINKDGKQILFMSVNKFLTEKLAD